MFWRGFNLAFKMIYHDYVPFITTKPRAIYGSSDVVSELECPLVLHQKPLLKPQRQMPNAPWRALTGFESGPLLWTNLYGVVVGL